MIQLTNDLAYLVGSLRDGSVCRFSDKTGKLHHSIAIYSKSSEWLNLLSEKFERVFKKKPSIVIPKNRTPFIRAYSKEIVEMLNEQFQHPIGKQIGWDTPSLIKIGDEEILQNYIAGFWDAEGGVDVHNKEAKFYLSWNGEKCFPLEFIKDILEKKFQIKSGRIGCYPNQNGVYPRFVLRVKKIDSKDFLEKIPVQHKQKKDKLISISGG